MISSLILAAALSGCPGGVCVTREVKVEKVVARVPVVRRLAVREVQRERIVKRFWRR